MATPETSPQQQETRRRGTRLLPKLASLAIRHADFLVVTSCVAGLVAVLLLPGLAKNTYISENALIPGSASPKFMLQDAKEAVQLSKELKASIDSSSDKKMALRSFVVKYLKAMGADFYLHPFPPPLPMFSSIPFFSSQSLSTGSLEECVKENCNASKMLGINIVGIVRARRGEGNEAIVLVTPFNPESYSDADTFSVGLGLSLLNLFCKAQWLAKDIIWLAADSRYSPHTAVSAWLRDYHEPITQVQPKFIDDIYLHLLYGMFGNNATSVLEDSTLADFKRAGVISAGLVFSLESVFGRGHSDALTVYAEGPNGQMPNLDLINVINNLAVYREGIQMKLDLMPYIQEWVGLHVFGQMFEKLGQMIAVLNSAWKFGLPASEYVHGAATLSRSLYLQALGIPTGPHGAFRDYQIDAVTIVMSYPKQDNGLHVGSLIKFGRLLEGTTRSVNNLLEKFHQSFFLYFLTGPNKFVSVGVYTIPLLLLLATLPLKAAALCSQPSDLSSGNAIEQEKVQNSSLAIVQPRTISSFAEWSFSVLLVCCVELWAFGVAVFPPVANYIVDAPTLKVAVWVAFSVVSLCLFLAPLMWLKKALSIPYNWIATKASILGAATIGIGIMSSINFAAALVGAIVLVPTCLIAYPVWFFRRRRPIWILAIAVPLLLSLFCLYSMVDISNTLDFSLQVLWSWVESTWKWGSATYLYLFLVHLPCSILCALLVFSRS